MLNYFKNLFAGNSTPELESPKQVIEERVISRKVTKIEIVDDIKVYPFFSNNNFEGNIPGNRAEVFHYNKEEEPYIYIQQALWEDDGTGLSLLDTGEMDDDVFTAFSKLSYDNLNKLQVPFRFEKDFGNKIITGQGSALACEKIMCEDHMLEAHRLLQSEEILVAIPRRGFMIVAPLRDKGENADFFNFHQYVWQGFVAKENQLISKDVFVMKNGEIDRVYFLDLDEPSTHTEDTA